MQAWVSAPSELPALFPEGSRTIQMMEDPLFSLQIVIATWQNTTPPWVTETIFAIMCGVVLFLFLLPWLERDPSLPPPRRHRNIRKRPVEPRRTSSRRKESGALKACRACLEDLDEAWGQIILLQSHLGRPPDLGGFRQLCCQDPPGEAYDTAPEGADLPCGEPAGGAAPATSPSASPAPLTPCLPPLASAPSAGHQDQADSKRMPPGPCVECFPSSNAFLASPKPAISDLGHSGCPISALSSWQATARTLYLSASPQCESQPEPVGHLPPEASFQKDPTHRQVETGSLSFVNPGVTKLLEILLTRRAELNVWKEKGKEGSSSQLVNPQSHLRSLGNLWEALGAEPDTTSPQPFWSFKDKAEQVPGPQQFSCLQFLGDQLQQKCSQLFWGLPSLHSESLVATAWVARNPSYLQPLSVLFNGLPSDFAVPIQPGTPSGPPQAPPVPLPGAQPQPLTGNLPQAQPPPLAQIQTHVISSLPVPPPSSPHQTGPSGGPCPTSQNKGASFVPTEVQHLEWSLLQEQQKREKTLPSVTQRSQDLFSQPSPNPPQERGAAQGPVYFFQRDFISPNLQKGHLPKRLIKDAQPGGVHFKVQVSVELMPGQGQRPGGCQAPDQQGPLRRSASARKSSPDSQRTESRHRRKCRKKGRAGKFSCRSSQRCVRRIPRGLSGGSTTFVLKVLGVNSKNTSVRHLKPSRSDSETGFLSPPKSHPEKLLQSHWGRELGPITQGSIPGRVGRSPPAHSHAFPGCHTDTETGAPASWKGRERCVNTSCDLPFLSPHTRQLLEGHLTKLQARQRWGLPVQAPEPTPLKPPEVQGSHLPQPPAPPSAVCVSEVCSQAKFTETLGKPPQVFSEETVTTRESFVTPAGGLPTPSLDLEQIQKDMGETPPAPGQGLSGAPLPGEESRRPPRPPARSPVGKPPKTGTVLGVETTSPEPREERGVQTSGDPCHGVATLEVNAGSCPSKAEAPEAVEAEEDPAWEVMVGPSVLASPQIWGTSGRPGPSPSASPPAPSAAPDPGEPCLAAQAARKLELQEKAESENQPQGPATWLPLQDHHSDIFLQDYATGLLLQDYASHVFLRDPHTDVPLAANILASHGALCSSQREHSSRDLPAARVPYDLILSGQSRRGWQEPGPSNVKDPRKNPNKMCVPADNRKDSRRPRPGHPQEGLAGLRTSPARGLSHPPQLRGRGDTPGRTCLQPLPEKGQVFPESPLKRMRGPAQGRGPEDPLPRGQPGWAAACSQEPGLSRRARGQGPVDVQAIMTAVGQILAQKLALHQGLRAKEFIQHMKQFRAPEGGRSCNSQVPSAPKHTTVMRDAAYSQHATPRGHMLSDKSRCPRDRNSRGPFPPREPGAPGRPGQQGQQGGDSRAEASSGGRWERTYRG